ncbi:MAG: hypothetical protein F6K30_27905 [Cyanothece sp. SIO2G6]|nr:hypothetical protein [Cyanothece sp. SIO2G6]
MSYIVAERNDWHGTMSLVYWSLRLGLLAMLKFYSVGAVSLAVALPLVGHEPLAIALEHQTPEVQESQPVVYDFTIDVTEGSLAGMSFDGSFCYDATVIAGVGPETIGVEAGLKTRIIFFDQLFTETDDSNYPEFPQLMFVDGEIEQLDFWIEAGDRLPWWNLPGWNVTLIPTEAETDCPADSPE